MYVSLSSLLMKFVACCGICLSGSMFSCRFDVFQFLLGSSQAKHQRRTRAPKIRHMCSEIAYEIHAVGSEQIIVALASKHKGATSF